MPRPKADDEDRKFGWLAFGCILLALAFFIAVALLKLYVIP